MWVAFARHSRGPCLHYGPLRGSASAIGFIVQKMKVDDRVDASPVHGFCGGWGLLAADLFDWGERLEPPPCLVWIQLQAR